MAWLAFVASLAFPVLLLAGAGRDLVELAWPFYTFTSATVGAYIGFATVDDRWQLPQRGQAHAYGGGEAGGGLPALGLHDGDA